MSSPEWRRREQRPHIFHHMALSLGLLCTSRVAGAQRHQPMKHCDIRGNLTTFVFRALDTKAIQCFLGQTEAVLESECQSS